MNIKEEKSDTDPATTTSTLTPTTREEKLQSASRKPDKLKPENKTVQNQQKESSSKSPLDDRARFSVPANPKPPLQTRLLVPTETSKHISKLSGMKTLNGSRNSSETQSVKKKATLKNSETSVTSDPSEMSIEQKDIKHSKDCEKGDDNGRDTGLSESIMTTVQYPRPQKQHSTWESEGYSSANTAEGCREKGKEIKPTIEWTFSPNPKKWRFTKSDKFVVPLLLLVASFLILLTSITMLFWYPRCHSQSTTETPETEDHEIGSDNMTSCFPKLRQTWSVMEEPGTRQKFRVMIQEYPAVSCIHLKLEQCVITKVPQVKFDHGKNIEAFPWAKWDCYKGNITSDCSLLVRHRKTSLQLHQPPLTVSDALENGNILFQWVSVQWEITYDKQRYKAMNLSPKGSGGRRFDWNHSQPLEQHSPILTSKACQKLFGFPVVSKINANKCLEGFELNPFSETCVTMRQISTVGNPEWLNNSVCETAVSKRSRMCEEPKVAEDMMWLLGKVQKMYLLAPASGAHITIPLTIPADRENGTCSLGWSFFEGQCYSGPARFDAPRKFDQARKDCSFRDGELPTIHNEGQNSFLCKVMNGNPSWIGLKPSEGNQLVWVGNQLVWVGNTSNFTSWYDDKQQHKKGCVASGAIYNYAKNIECGNWLTESCIAKRFYSCVRGPNNKDRRSAGTEKDLYLGENVVFIMESPCKKQPERCHFVISYRPEDDQLEIRVYEKQSGEYPPLSTLCCSYRP